MLARPGAIGLDGAMSPAGRRPHLPLGALAALLLPGLALAQVPQMPPPAAGSENLPFTLSAGPGVTANLSRPGDWTGTFTVAFGWSVDERWTIVVGPYWEREFDHVDGTTWVYDEISVAVGVSYAFAPLWSVGFELDFGLVHDAFGPWERNPEFGIGVGVSRAFPLGGTWNLVVGPELSWKISDDEWSIGLNTGVSFDF